MESVKVIVVGFGDRGAAYTKYALDNPDRLKVIAVVDPNPFRRELAKEKFALEEDMLFSCVEDCVRRGKFADAVINTTMDELHIKTALPFLNLGYDMLLEKPITNNKKELTLLKKAADEKNCRLMICHVLRYTPFYLKIGGSPFSDSTTYSETLFLLYSFKTGSNCFGSGIILLEEVVFGKSVIRQRFPFSSRPSWQVLFTASVPFVKSISAQVSASNSPIRKPE